MKSLAEELAKCFYELHERQVFMRHNFASTSLLSKIWNDLSERYQLEYVEAFRQLLLNKELVGKIKNYLDER